MDETSGRHCPNEPSCRFAPLVDVRFGAGHKPAPPICTLSGYVEGINPSLEEVRRSDSRLIRGRIDTHTLPRKSEEYPHEAQYSQS